MRALSLIEVSDGVDLEQHARMPETDLDGGAGWRIGGEVGRPHLVEGREVREVREKAGRGHNIRQRRILRGQGRLQVVERLLGVACEVLHRVAVGVEPYVPRHVDDVAHTAVEGCGNLGEVHSDAPLHRLRARGCDTRFTAVKKLVLTGGSDHIRYLITSRIRY